MADEKSEVPGMLENWGLHTKTARPESVGPHDVKENQQNPADPGIEPEAGYKPSPGDDAASAGPGGQVAIASVKPAEEIKPGAKRDAPPLTGAVE